MDEEKSQQLDFGIHSRTLITMLEEFVNALDAPQTQATLKKELTRLGVPRQSRIEEEFQQESEGEEMREMPIKTEENQEKINQAIDKYQEAKEAGNDMALSGQKNQINNTLQWSLQSQQMEAMLAKCLPFREMMKKLAQLEANKNKADLQSEMIDESSQMKAHNFLKDPYSTPKLAQIFSAFESIKQMRKIHLPVNHTITIEPKTSKSIKFLGISSKEHYLAVVDMDSNMFIYNTNTKKLVHDQKKQAPQKMITSLKWLSGDLLAIGKANGSLDFSIVCLDLKILASVKQAHSGAVLDIFEYQGYLYSIGSDHQMTVITKRHWKVAHRFNISITPQPHTKFSFLNPPCKIVKVKDQRLKNVCFLMDASQGRVWMFDEISQLEKDEFKVNVHCRGGILTNMVAHQKSKSLLLTVSEKSQPEIFQIFPSKNQIVLRISGVQIVNQIVTPLKDRPKNNLARPRKKVNNIYCSYFHEGEVLAYTSTLDQGLIRYVSLRNWRILHSQDCSLEKTQQNERKKVYDFCGMVAASGDIGVEQENELIFQFEVHQRSNGKGFGTDLNGWKESRKQQQTELRHEKIVYFNKNSGDLEVFDTEKSDLSVIRSEQERLRRMLALGSNLPRGTEGFLTLIQNIRDNYSVFF